MNNSRIEAQKTAHELLRHAKENEPQITEILKQIAMEISAKTVGLENKFKTEESLIRKLVSKANFNLESVRKVAENTNDVLRYTFILPFETYAKNFRLTIEMLQNSGYHIPQNRIWNAWQTAGKRFDKGYRGINITVISSQNQKFEIQFHTADSYRLKNETHYLYEELRKPEISKERQVKLIEELRNAAKDIKRPDGV